MKVQAILAVSQEGYYSINGWSSEENESSEESWKDLAIDCVEGSEPLAIYRVTVEIDGPPEIKDAKVDKVRPLGNWRTNDEEENHDD